MKFLFYFLLLLFCIIFSNFSIKAQTIEEKTSLAILVEDAETQSMFPELNKTISQNDFIVQEESLTQTIRKKLTFPNQLNLSTKEARNLGQALGVDVFLILKSKIVERAEVGATLYGEGSLAIFFVSSKSGKLMLFDFLETKQTNLALAKENIAKELINKIPFYTKEISDILTKQLAPLNLDPQDLEAIDIPSEGSTLAKNFDLPEFISRKQPTYTENARKMSVSAVVELEVILRKDGKIGTIEVIHWAGFGLDESAITAVKELKFEPGLLDGQAISCRALIRYNFNLKNQR